MQLTKAHSSLRGSRRVGSAWWRIFCTPLPAPGARPTTSSFLQALLVISRYVYSKKQLSSMHSILLGLFPSLFDESGLRQHVRTLQDLTSKPDRPLNVIISNMDNVISALLYTIINSNLNSSSTSSPWHMNGFLDSLTRSSGKVSTVPLCPKKRWTRNINFFTMFSSLFKFFIT